MPTSPRFYANSIMLYAFDITSELSAKECVEVFEELECSLIAQIDMLRQTGSKEDE